jgi:hypothetical protein
MIENICLLIAERVFQQTVGMPMDINCYPLLNKMDIGSLVVLLAIFVKLFGFQIFWPMSVPDGSYSRNVVDIFKLL